MVPTLLCDQVTCRWFLVDGNLVHLLIHFPACPCFSHVQTKLHTVEFSWSLPFYMFTGESLSEPHTGVTSLHMIVCVCACLLACYHELLACRATPLQNSYSPSELLICRMLRTTVPSTCSQQSPRIPGVVTLRAKDKHLKA